MQLTLPLENPAALEAGTEVLLSGLMYGARDQAHKRMIEILDRGEDLPMDIRGQVIYYVGPAPTPQGQIIGSAGPTTASRMDPFAPRLLDAGLAGMIGKGPRSEEVVESLKANGAVYFYAYGGCGALYAQAIKSVSVVAFEDLGPEAIYRFEVKDFPVMVAIDAAGRSVFA